MKDTSNTRYLSLPGTVRSELGSKVKSQPANSRKLNEEWGLQIMIIEVRIKVANKIGKFLNVEEWWLDTCNPDNTVHWLRAFGIRWPKIAPHLLNLSTPQFPFFYKMGIRSTLLDYFENYIKGITIWSFDHNIWWCLFLEEERFLKSLKS